MSEMVDVLNEHGELTGESVTRHEAHARELWHPTTHVMIVDSLRRVLVQIRAETVGHAPNLHDAVMVEHVKAGETPLEGALRGLWEEYGLEVAAERLRPIVRIGMETVNLATSKKHRSVANVHLLQSDVTEKDLRLQEAEVASVYHRPLHEVEESLVAEDSRYLWRPPHYAHTVFPRVRSIIEI